VSGVGEPGATADAVLTWALLRCLPVRRLTEPAELTGAVLSLGWCVSASVSGESAVVGREVWVRAWRLV